MLLAAIALVRRRPPFPPLPCAGTDAARPPPRRPPLAGRCTRMCPLQSNTHTHTHWSISPHCRGRRCTCTVRACSGCVRQDTKCAPPPEKCLPCPCPEAALRRPCAGVGDTYDTSVGRTYVSVRWGSAAMGPEVPAATRACVQQQRLLRKMLAEMHAAYVHACNTEGASCTHRGSWTHMQAQS